MKNRTSGRERTPPSRGSPEPERNQFWHDNRPRGRFDPRFLRLFYLILAAVFGPGAVLIYESYTWLGGSPSNGAILAIVLGTGGATAFGLEALWLASGMPSEVGFDTEQMLARTRSGRLRAVPYSEITRVSTTRWKGDWSDGQCTRYVVRLKPRSLGVARALWFTPKSPAMLRDGVRAAGMSPPRSG